MPKKPNPTREYLAENRLRTIVRRLRDASVVLLSHERELLAHTLESVLSTPAEKRWMAALRKGKRGAPCKKSSVEHHEWGSGIAQCVAKYRDGNGADKLAHSVSASRDDDGAYVLATNALELDERLVRHAWEAFGHLYPPGEAKKSRGQK